MSPVAICPAMKPTLPRIRKADRNSKHSGRREEKVSSRPRRPGRAELVWPVYCGRDGPRWPAGAGAKWACTSPRARTVGSRLGRQRLLEEESGSAVEGDQPDELDLERGRCLADGGDRNPRGPIGGKAIDPGRDRWERNRAGAKVIGDLERAPVAGGEELGFAPVAAPPAGTDRVDHPAGRQAEARRFLGVPGGAAAELAARLQQLRARGTVDGAVDSATPEQGFVRCVDDRIDPFPGDVADHDFDRQFGRPATW